MLNRVGFNFETAQKIKHLVTDIQADALFCMFRFRKLNLNNFFNTTFEKRSALQ